MDYRQALEFVAQLADFERASTDRIRYRDFNLPRVRAFLAGLGDPHLAVPCVHVAGTKGKGSTVAMVASALRSAGFRTGLYTSPHLHTIRERIAVDGEPVTEEAFAGLVARLAPLVTEFNRGGPASETSPPSRLRRSTPSPFTERGQGVRYGPLTTFEMLTAMAFIHFRDSGCQLSVLEVGLGGRLDATNVVRPLVCGITNISFDHVELLGNTLAAIAGEKAAIIKPGVPAVSAPQEPEALEVIQRAARENRSALTLAGRDITWEPGESTLEGQRFTLRSVRGEYPVWTPLLGDFQMENAATALGLCEALMDQGVPVTSDAVLDGLAKVSWPARLEVLRRGPLVVVDGAHNRHSMKRLVAEVRRRLPHENVILVFGVTGGKDLDGMMDEMAGFPSRVVTCRSRHPKASDAVALASAAMGRGMAAEAAPDTASAVTKALAMAGPRDLVLVTGSLFVAAEAREAVLGIAPDPYPWGTPARP